MPNLLKKGLLATVSRLSGLITPSGAREDASLAQLNHAI